MLQYILQVTAEKQELKPLVVVGSVNADLVLEVDRLPADGETLGAKTLNTFPGGKASPSQLDKGMPASCWKHGFATFQPWVTLQGANQAAAAAKLQHPTYMLGQASFHIRSAQLDCFFVADMVKHNFALVSAMHLCWG